MTGDLGPGVRARGRTAGTRGATCRGCPTRGATSAAAGAASRRARPARARGSGDQPNTRANLNRNRNKRFEDWMAGDPSPARAGAELQARPAAARPVAVPARTGASTAAGQRPDPQVSRQSYKDEGQMRPATAAPPAPAGLRRPRARSADRPPQGDRPVRQSLIVVTADHGVSFDRGALRPPQGRPRRTSARSRPCRCSSNARPAHGEGGRQRRGDHRRRAHDRRRPGHRPAREGGRQVGVQPGGPGARRGEDAQARPVEATCA